jgi:hypothetical protein
MVNAREKIPGGGICEGLVNGEIDLLSPIQQAIGLNNWIRVA